MNIFKANQKLLFKVETVFNLRPLEKYEIFFLFLISHYYCPYYCPTYSLNYYQDRIEGIIYPATGSPPIPYEALLKALIYKNIKMYLIFF